MKTRVACRAVDLADVRFFVLDEADEMLNMGFQDDVETILEDVPPARQTLMFSATMPQWVRKLANKYCNNYIMVDLVGDTNTGTHLPASHWSCPHEITGQWKGVAVCAGCCTRCFSGCVSSCEHSCLSSSCSQVHQPHARVTGTMNQDINCLACMVPPNLHAKRLLLVDLITTYSQAGKTIVFCNTKRECESVVSGVSAMMPAEALHGDIAQEMREFTMNRFREVRRSMRAIMCMLHGSMISADERWAVVNGQMDVDGTSKLHPCAMSRRAAAVDRGSVATSGGQPQQLLTCSSLMDALH
jgi:hypothetical protein